MHPKEIDGIKEIIRKKLEAEQQEKTPALLPTPIQKPVKPIK